MADYSLAQAQADVAALRGQLAHLAANSELLNLTIDTRLLIGGGASLVATDPVSGGAETWHTLGTLSNFNITRARFRLDAEGELEIDIGIDGNGSNVSGSAFSVTLPSAYRPAVIRRCTLSQTGRNITAGDEWPAVIVATTGVVTIQAHAGITTALHANPHFPLD